MAMTFQLKDFDGPLDLLLHLIAKEQINIRDIFISDITDQYIAAVHSAPDLDMEEASEFLVMAATLLEIKSRALLPKPPEPKEGEEDPEQELIRRLEEYKRIQDSAEQMKAFESAARRMYAKLPDEFPLPPQEYELVGLTLEGLTEALLRIWTRKPKEEQEYIDNHYRRRAIVRDEHNVQSCMVDLMRSVQSHERVSFTEIFRDVPTREAVVTYFLALLELLKLREMHVEQSGTYGEITLVRGPAETPDEEGQEDKEDKGKEGA